VKIEENFFENQKKGLPKRPNWAAQTVNRGIFRKPFFTFRKMVLEKVLILEGKDRIF